MNERIKEIAERVVGQSRLHNDEFALIGNYHIERFAKLIIEECLKVLCETTYPNAYKKHTGVAEIKTHFNFPAEYDITDLVAHKAAVKARINRLLEPLLGSDELVELWWVSPNRAFEQSTPQNIFDNDTKKVLQYVLQQYR